MNDAERLHVVRVFVGALKILSRGKPQQARIPLNERIFSEVAHELRRKGNTFAQHVEVVNTSTGLRCPDLELGIKMAMNSGLLTRDYDDVHPYLTEQELARLQTDKEFPAVQTFVRRYFELMGLSSWA